MAEDFDLSNETGAIEAPCWRNLWFVRDGRSYRGPLRFRSSARPPRWGIVGWIWSKAEGC